MDVRDGMLLAIMKSYRFKLPIKKIELVLIKLGLGY